MSDRQATTTPPDLADALMSLAKVVGVVVLVLALLVLGVYAVVVVDLIPQMQ